MIAAFCLAIHNGGSLLEAIAIAKSITRPYDSTFHELLQHDSQTMDNDLANDVKDLAASVKTALCQMTDETIVSKAMAKYPKAPFSDLVRLLFSITRCHKTVNIFNYSSTERQSDRLCYMVPNVGL